MIARRIHRRGSLGSAFFWLPLLFCLFFVSTVVPSHAQVPQAPQESTPTAAEKLWNRAMDLRAAGDRERAANTFLRVYQDYPESPMAEDSLLQAIYYYREAAQFDRSRLDTLEELYKRFITGYPGSKQAEKIHFELGRIYYEKRYYREALARFRLFLKKFPDSPLQERANYLEAKTYLQLGHIEQARKLFEKYAASKNKELRAKGLAGMGEIYNREEKYEKALKTLKESLSLSPTLYLNSPEAEVLRELGMAYIKLGNEEYGRQHLFHYLNIVGNSADRLDILLEIAESFHRQGLKAAAQGVYNKIVEEGDETDKPYIIARFRVASFLDDPDNVLSKWQRHGDLADPEGDLPYTSLLAVIDQGPLAQDARRGLFRRYQARDDFADALNVARIYLRELSDKEKGAKPRKAANDMLLYVTEHLIKAGDYSAVYDFYKAQHRHVVQYPGGRLLYLVGQALEALYLYKQAAIVYWRALGLPLTDAEKTDLYYRRARVYLAQPDLPAAERLLGYLRDLYDGSKAVGEVYSLSGRLAELKKEPEAAWKYYRQAFEIATLPERKEQYATDYLRLLLETGRLSEMQQVLTRIGSEQGWLSPELLQQWLVRLGAGLEKRGETAAAVKNYEAALAEAMPQSGEQAQKAQLALGDIIFRQGQKDDAQKRYEQAATGPDSLLSSLAKERLKQMGIEQSLSNLDLPAGK